MININPPRGLVGVVVGLLMAGFFGVLIYRELYPPQSIQPFSHTEPASAASGEWYFVDDTRPPDPYLALLKNPGDDGPHVMDMPNGTLLEVLEKRQDGWWRVRVMSNDREGWALNRSGDRVWIHCCRTSHAD